MALPQHCFPFSTQKHQHRSCCVDDALLVHVRSGRDVTNSCVWIMWNFAAQLCVTGKAWEHPQWLFRAAKCVKKEVKRSLWQALCTGHCLWWEEAEQGEVTGG